MRDRINNLLKSPFYGDVIIGLTLIKDWSWEELQRLDIDNRYDNVDIALTIRTKAKGDLLEDNYILNNNIFCHFNHSIFFYQEESFKADQTYKQL